MFEDNQGAIGMAENPISGGRTKYVNMWYHFVREVKCKVVEIQYTDSRGQHGIIITKPIGVAAFVRQCRFLVNFPGCFFLLLPR